jgi:uncharacterized RDD family membrane protein YckC
LLAAKEVTAPLARRLASLVYEALLLAAVLWCAALPLELIEAGLEASFARPLFQAYLVFVSGVYFVPQWVRGGQTLPMKTWRLRLVDREGRAATLRQAALRYIAALAGLLLAGIGFLWALFDRDHQFLHDRIARTRIVRIPQR